MESGPARVLYLGLDAFDVDLMEQLAASGRCPNFAALLSDSAVVPTVAPYGTFVGSSWMTISTGRDPSRHRYWNWLVVDPATYTEHSTTPRSAVGEPFWQQVADAGQRVAVFDVPHMDVIEKPGSAFIKEWGCHDRHDGTASFPLSLLDELDQVAGRHPVGCRDHPDGEEAFAPCDYTLRASQYRSLDEERELVGLLRDGVNAKGRATKHLLDQGPWDLFVAVLGEGHCVGHQFWHLHDTNHPRHDPAARRTIGDPVTDIYERLDGLVGDLVAEAGPDTTLFVQCNHGMGPHFDGDHLLDELLLRIDQGLAGHFQPSERSKLAGRALALTPMPVRGMLQRALMVAARSRVRRRPPPVAIATGPQPTRRWYQLSGNTSVGAVRFNLRGREAHGLVAPGREYEDLRDAVERALLDVIDIDTGRTLVQRVVRAEEIYDHAPDDLLPDLFVEWNRETLIECVWSPLTGVVMAPYAHWRTGDHHDRGLLVARGPGIQPGRRATPMALTDVAPTVAAAAGVTLHDVDGVAHPDLLPRGAAVETPATTPRPPALQLAIPKPRRRRRTPPRNMQPAPPVPNPDPASLQRQLDALQSQMQLAERERALWATMAWLAHEPVRNDTLVSVITPTYHRPEALAAAIRSVLAQRHEQWEMVIVDDGSATARAVVAECNDSRLRLLETDHGGACAARNVALDHVQGDLVAYLDDDNLFDPGWLHAVAWAFEHHPEASVLYGARLIDDAIRVHGVGEGGWPMVQFNPFDRDALELGNFADMGVIAHRADVPTRFDTSLVECGDWDFFLGLTEHTVPLELPVVAAYYRTSGKDRLTGQQPSDADRVRAKWASRRLL